MSKVKSSFLLILILMTDFCTKSVHTEFQGKHPEYYKLPNHTKPTHYDIKLRTGIAKNDLMFTGNSIISITVLENTDTLVFHARGLIFDESQTSLYDEYQRTIILPIKHSYDRMKEITILHFTLTLKAGTYVLSLRFTGALNYKGVGFHATYYPDDQKRPRWVASTLFEPTYARYAFPCWDEPALKATFDISIQHDRNYTAISNMPILHEKYADDMIETKFRTSPVMSTYLVAFVVSDFEYVTNEYKNFSVWTSKDRIHEAIYARDVGQVILRELEQFTGIPLVLPKTDQIALPEMKDDMFSKENWGLIMYRSTYLLYNNESSESVKVLVTSFIAHELAHQWFGNLVTPASWEYNWMKEGFGTYFGYYIPDKINATWKMMDRFFIETQLQDTFPRDFISLNESVRIPKGTTSLTAQIAYNKAACIIRMMSHMLTEKVFQEGLKIHLRSRSFTYATPNYLFDSLQEAVDKSGLFSKKFSVKTVMDTWIQQPCYPVLYVTRDYKNNSLIIEQERYSDEAEEIREYTHDYKWYIPVTYATREDLNFNNTFAQIFLEPNNQSMELSIDLSPASWIILNVQGTGFYRVNYDVKNWLLIAKYLKTKDFINIHKLNRAQLIDDAWNMAAIGRLNYSVALGITDYLKREHELELWAVALPKFKRINRMLVHTQYKYLFQNYITKMMGKLTLAIKYEEQPEESDLHSFIRIHLIDWSCAVGLRGCRSFARKKLEQWLSNSLPRDLLFRVDLVVTILCGGLRDADQDTWNAVFERYTEATSQGKFIIEEVLICSSSDKILTRYLKMLLEPGTGIALDSAVGAILENNPGMIDVILNFMLQNIPKIKSRECLKDIVKMNKRMVPVIIRPCGKCNAFIAHDCLVATSN